MNKVTRFQVLKDKTTVIKAGDFGNDGLGNYHGVTSKQNFNFHYKWAKGLEILCEGDTDVITSCIKNSLHLIGVTNSLRASVSYTARVRYVG